MEVHSFFVEPDASTSRRARRGDIWKISTRITVAFTALTLYARAVAAFSYVRVASRR